MEEASAAVQVNKKWNVEKKRKALVFLLAVGIFLIVLRNLSFADQIVIINDEFGYWGNTVAINHLDWSDFLEKTPYYSSGYSVFLTLISLFCKSGQGAYRLGIVLNGLFLVGAFLLCERVLRNLWSGLQEQEWAVTPIVSALCVATGANLYQTQFTWTETCLLFFMWLCIAVLVSYEKKPRLWKWLILMGLVGYMYFIHQRSIGVVLTLLILTIAVGIEWVKGRKKPKLGIGMSLLLSAVILTGGSLLISVTSQAFGEEGGNLVMAATANQINAEFLQKLFRKVTEQTADLGVSFLGKVFAVLFLTLFTGFLPVKRWVLDGVSFTRTKRKPPFYLTWTFVVLSGMAMLCASVSVIGSSRYDLIVYTRYMDFAINPLMAFGFMLLFVEFKRYWLLYGFSALVLCGLSFPVMKLYNTGSNYFNTVCSPVIGGWIYLFSSKLGIDQGDGLQIFLRLVLIGGFVFCMVMLGGLIRTRGKKAFHKWIGICLMGGVVILFQIMILYAGDIWLGDYHHNLDEDCNQIVETVQEYDYPVYYMGYKKGSSYCHFGKYVQYLVWDTKITVWEGDVAEIPDSKFLLLAENTQSKKYKLISKLMNDGNCHMITQSGAISVFLYEK